jgi:hypothetical protein
MFTPAISRYDEFAGLEPVERRHSAQFIGVF